VTDSNKVSINIPRSNPLFQWAWGAALKMNTEPLEYGSLTVGGIKSRLALVSVNGIQCDAWSRWGDEPYMSTEWVLLEDPYP
jgi:hypothetical protein